MAKRAPESVTRQEVQTYIAWMSAHGIKNEDNTPDADHNAEVVANCLLEWGAPWTRENLDKALPQIQAQLRFYTPAQQSWNHASANLSPADRQKILDYVGRSQHLNTEGDNLYLNAAAFANFITEKRIPIQNLEHMVSQIVQSRYRLVTKTRPQDSEREAKANREAFKNIQQPKNEDEVKIPAGLNPALHEWYRQTHKKAQSATPSTPESTISHYETLARAAAVSVQSNVDRAEAERLLTRAGAWGWELVYRSIEGFIQRRKQQRWLAGR